MIMLLYATSFSIMQFCHYIYTNYQIHTMYYKYVDYQSEIYDQIYTNNTIYINFQI